MRISDWSSDVCSSDLGSWRRPSPARACRFPPRADKRNARCPSCRRSLPPQSPDDRGSQDRKSVVKGKSVSVRVDLGGRRINKTKKTTCQLQIKNVEVNII